MLCLKRKNPFSFFLSKPTAAGPTASLPHSFLSVGPLALLAQLVPLPLPGPLTPFTPPPAHLPFTLSGPQAQPRPALLLGPTTAGPSLRSRALLTQGETAETACSCAGAAVPWDPQISCLGKEGPVAPFISVARPTSVPSPFPSHRTALPFGQKEATAAFRRWQPAPQAAKLHPRMPWRGL